MKKYLLTLALAAGTLAANATALSVERQLQLRPQLRPEFKVADFAPEAVAVAPRLKAAEQTEEVYYSLADDPAQAFSLNSISQGMQAAMAFQIDPSFLATLTDGTITSISYYTGTQLNESVNKITKAYVFITDELGPNAPFLYTQEVEAPSTAFTKVDVQLTEPYVIPADKEVYVGVYFNLNSEYNAPFVVDYAGHLNDYGGWYAVRTGSKQPWQWDNIAEYYGFFNLGATIASSTFPKNSVAVLAVAGQPRVNENETFGFQFLMQNTGVNTVNAVTVEFGIDGEEKYSEDFTLPTPLAMNQLFIGSVPQMVSNLATKSTTLSFKVSAVDGVANTSATPVSGYELVVVPEGKAKYQNAVIEEFTSTSCVFCPVGYTTMEAIHENFTEGNIIPVCVHANYPGRDPLVSSTYNRVYSTYCTEGVPSTTVNRTYSQYPSYNPLVQLVQEVNGLPAIADVTGEVTNEEGTRKFTINTKTSFVFDYTDGADNFVLSYGVTENNVGPEKQQNGYAGLGQEVEGGWQDQPDVVELIYNDVARQLDTFAGISGSVPAEITAGVEYEYSHTLSVVNAVNDLSNINFIVYLLNKKTGEIVNATTIKSPVVSGIADIITDASDAPVEYFNLQGIKVTNPAAGIYIRRQGGEVSKVLVK